MLYNPPVVNPGLGLRANALEEVRRDLRAASRAALCSRSTSFDARQMVEVLTKYLKDRNRERGLPTETVCAYRGGYLPKLRRSKVERGCATARSTRWSRPTRSSSASTSVRSTSRS